MKSVIVAWHLRLEPERHQPAEPTCAMDGRVVAAKVIARALADFVF